METSAIISLFTLSFFCFAFIFWLKNFEKKHTYKKLKLVDKFIQKNNIEVNKMFVDQYFDLIDDAKGENIWYFYLKNNTLHYKNIPYKDIFQVEYKLDGSTVRSTIKKGQLKHQLVAGNNTNLDIEIVGNKQIAIDEKYRIKEVMITILIDELKPYTIDFVFMTTHIPVEFKNLQDKEAREWYKLFQKIIRSEEGDYNE